MFDLVNLKQNIMLRLWNNMLFPPVKIFDKEFVKTLLGFIK